MATKNSKSPTISNRQARFEYHFIETHIAGIVLKGTEIKSVRESKVNLKEAYCYFRDGELYIKDMHINPYEMGNIHNVDPVRERKLLMSKMELKKLKAKSEEKGLTIIPVKLFFNDRNLAKIEIALAQGKKLYDKREDIKSRDTQRMIQRELND